MKKLVLVLLLVVVAGCGDKCYQDEVYRQIDIIFANHPAWLEEE